MSLVTLHRQWLNRVASQGVFVSPAALAEADAFPTEPDEAMRSALWGATGPNGVLVHPEALLTDPAALGWPADHFIDVSAAQAAPLRETLPSAPEASPLRILGVLYDQPGAAPLQGPHRAPVALVAATTMDIDAQGADGASPARAAEGLGRAARTPLVILFGLRDVRLIHAPEAGPAGSLSFPVAQLLAEDGVLLGALHMLLGERRLLSLPDDKRLPALLAASRDTAIRTLALQDFTVFARAELHLSRGINVLMGPNGSGKTHALKALYAILQILGEEDAGEPAGARVARKLRAVFLPDGADLGRLVRWNQERAVVSIAPARGPAAELVLHPPIEPLLEAGETWQGPARPTYVPTREVLALYEGFAAAYQTRQIAFDETIYDACLALQSPLLRHLPEELASVLNKLGGLLDGSVVLRGNRFYVQRGERLVEAQLLAEGLRKVAAVAQLVANGSIAPFGTLLWDEPEGNLNPTLVVRVADLLVDLAALGVQVIVTSHDYLFIRRLSLLSEYKKRPDVPIRFFGLCPTDRGVEIETGDVLADLAHNPILDEFTRQGDYERELFYEAPG